MIGAATHIGRKDGPWSILRDQAWEFGLNFGNIFADGLDKIGVNNCPPSRIVDTFERSQLTGERVEQGAKLS